ncbi:M20/M25/M40 family metallo-hydrolase [Rhodohalobacter mucosus]|uniref:Peptidase M20 n=1 Tax=Rhodohalobacter mucosus TaxID=2079485 RepID=A0A316TN76_9BACT|nr:M20/M25/M40 family metallo-hydrolase [Rhodohalobacter mucosus]PWN06063.1 peptidase M20 [Rhodohalobacter mucosus]
MLTRLTVFLFVIAISIGLPACSPDADQTIDVPERVDEEQLISDLKFLSSDELEGRLTGTEGNRIAREFIEQRYDSLNLSMFGDSYQHLFNHVNPGSGDEFIDAVNLIGYAEGSANPDRYIVVTAHYDHLGMVDQEIYNGADDNASGTAALLAAARYFSQNQPQNSIIFLALDAEEQGLGGARWFVENPVVPLDSVVMNVNMDMISANFENEIFAAGTSHYPFLKPIIEGVAVNSEVNVEFGYDSEDWPQDWTMSSDHGPFHEKGVPFIYFGVVDHPNYHQPTDTFENTNPDFFVDASEMIVRVVEALDLNLDTVAEESGRF